MKRLDVTARRDGRPRLFSVMGMSLRERAKQVFDYRHDRHDVHEASDLSTWTPDTSVQYRVRLDKPVMASQIVASTLVKEISDDPIDIAMGRGERATMYMHQALEDGKAGDVIRTAIIMNELTSEALAKLEANDYGKLPV